jgi:hypothetical protein
MVFYIFIAYNKIIEISNIKTIEILILLFKFFSNEKGLDNSLTLLKLKKVPIWNHKLILQTYHKSLSILILQQLIAYAVKGLEKCWRKG